MLGFKIITGVVISSNCLRISFLLKHHNLNITDLFFKILEQKVVMLYNKNRIHEQLDDMATTIISRHERFLFKLVYVMTMKHLSLRTKKLQTVSVRKALCTWTLY